MSSNDIYKELSKKLMFENSVLLPEIWRLICSEEEAEIINAMPATDEELSERFGKSIDEMNVILHLLFVKGVVFESVRDGKKKYRMPRHFIQFHDASILWPDVTQEYMDLWVRFLDEEAPQFFELLKGADIPSFMRIVPINKNLEPKSQILPYEDAARLIEDADSLAVVDCTCRKSVKKCDAPLEVCIQLNRGADYTIQRGTGREIDKDEALKLLKISEEAGLVHVVENKGYGNVICNCCSCCCIMFNFVKTTKQKWIMAPSRYLASIDEGECTSCGSCVEICPVEAVSMNENDIAVVKEEECIGCGLCANECPVEAIILKETRPESHIPS